MAVNFFHRLNIVTAYGLQMILLCAIVGCGGTAKDLPQLGQVSGIVTMDGAPLADAELTFEPKSGSPSVGRTDDAGKYQLAYNQNSKGAVLGQHTVRISKFGEPGSPNDTMDQVPAKYNTNSKETAEVKEGENEINFDLNSKAK
ncbi:hypothetical protein Pan241w_01720 [Gimesia alba]|uniref:Carboxypeptidase regulatory-like domain-containing protein n=1 Tax=Gimesia alba TaxID=2527973 RepID=A0A517R899_9PLAN|nr:hypothetical protein [Gimesia alba]QDT40119.1 hypothetical protein Pan241w_01720 [Gimesia alba]